MDSANATVLHVAAAYGHDEVVAELISVKANIAAKDLEGKTPLVMGQGEKRERKKSLLFVLCFALLFFFLFGILSHFLVCILFFLFLFLVWGRAHRLLAAAQSGRLSTVQRLLTLAGDQAEQLLAHHDSHGNNALHLAVSQGHTDMASFLLANHSDPNAKNINGNTALHLAGRKSKFLMLLSLRDGRQVQPLALHDG